MDARTGTKAGRNEHSLALRARAPIAANLEDCLQALDRLRAALAAQGSASKDAYAAADNCWSRLASWGRESGASGESLDYALRWSFGLRDVTLDLLRDLTSTLQRVNEAIAPQQPPKIELSAPDSSAATEDTEDKSLVEDEAADIELEQDLEEVADIVLDLNNLLPNLLDPSQDHGSSSAPPERNAALDIQQAMAIFPLAPEFLTERVGTANFRRRQHIKLVKFRDRSRSSSRSPGRGARPRARRMLPSIKSARSLAGLVSESNWSRVPSTVFSKLSKGSAYTDATTQESLGACDDCEDAELVPPGPPQLPDTGQPFSCPFCGLVIIPGLQLSNIDDWNDHVLQDLQPYLCTFESCLASQKTYRFAEDWFQHELECHRVRRVWVCGRSSCRVEFDTVERLGSHISSTHKDMPSSQFEMMAETCKRYSEKSPPDLGCVLCGSACADQQALKHHLAHHLEQFALLAIFEDSPPGSESTSENGDAEIGQERPSNPLLPEFLEYLDTPLVDGAKVTEELLASLEASDGSIEELGSMATNRASRSREDEEDGSARPKKLKVPFDYKVKSFLFKGPWEGEGDEAEASTPAMRTNSPPANVGFVGRAETLAAMREFLSNPGRICVLSGDGGVGKTTTATEYSYLAREYSHVLWVEAATVGGCADSYNLIATSLELGDIEKRIRTSDGVTILIREYLARLGKRWLLVFDNVEGWLDINRYIPTHMENTQGSVLITTRNATLAQSTSANYRQFNLTPLTDEEGTQMLLHSMQQDVDEKDIKAHPDYALALKAVRVVKRLPLAISMIAGFLNGSSCSLLDFLDLWEEGQEAKSSPSDVADPIDAMWEICIQELPLQPRNLLDILSFLDPDAIPKDLLLGEHAETDLAFLSSLQPLRFQRMIDVLSARRLLNVKEKGGQQVFSMHRLLQWKIQAGLEASPYRKAFNRAFTLVRKKYPRPSQMQFLETSKWEDCKNYTPHVTSLLRALQSATLVDPSMDLAQLFYDAGFGVWSRQTAAVDGIAFLDFSESTLDSLGVDRYHRLRSDIHSIFGDLCETIGASKRGECLRRREEALSTRKKIFDDDQSDQVNEILWIKAANDYGVGLMDANKFAEAGSIFDSCHKAYCRRGSEEEIPHEYAKYYRNNGLVLMWRGKYAEAISSLRRAIHLTELFSGKEWLCLQLQFDLACVLLQSGDIKGALDLHNDTFNARLELYGKHAQSTTLSRYAVAALHDHAGDKQKAIEILKECAESSRNYNWPEEALARARFHLSRLYAEQGTCPQEARLLGRQARDIMNKYMVTVSDVDDTWIMYDDLQPIPGGRFLGFNLLRHLQEKAGITADTHDS